MRASSARTRRSVSRTSRSGTSGTSRTRRRSGSFFPMRSSRSTTCSTASRGSSRVSSCARSGCARTSSRRGGLFFSQRLLLALVDSGLDRDVAYRAVQRHAMRAWDEGLDFRELVRADCGDRRTRRPRRGLRPRCVHRSTPMSSSLGCEASPGWENRFVPDAVHVASGKVREIYALDDERLLLVASDRLSTFDVVLADADPRQGARPHGPLGVLVLADTAHRPEPSPRDPARRPVACLPEARDAPDRVRRAGVSLGLRLAGLPRDRCGLRPRAAGGAAGVRAFAGTDLHPRDEGDRRARREHRRGAGGGALRRRMHISRRRPPRWRSTSTGRLTPRSAGSSSRTRSSSSGTRPTARSCSETRR